MGQARRWANRAVVAVALCWMLAPTARADDAAAVQALIDEASAVCFAQPAQACVDLGWAFAVSDPTTGLTLADVEALRARVGTWFATAQSSLAPQVKTMVAMGMLLVDGRGLDRVLGYFDADRNGAVSQAELLADVTMDDRPLPEIVADPEAVDRLGLAERLELPPQLVLQVLDRQ